MPLGDRIKSRTIAIKNRSWRSHYEHIEKKQKGELKGDFRLAAQNLITGFLYYVFSFRC